MPKYFITSISTIGQAKFCAEAIAVMKTKIIKDRVIATPAA